MFNTYRPVLQTRMVTMYHCISIDVIDYRYQHERCRGLCNLLLSLLLCDACVCVTLCAAPDGQINPKKKIFEQIQVRQEIDGVLYMVSTLSLSLSLSLSLVA